MSDSDESGVTHTEISSPYEDLSDIEHDDDEDSLLRDRRMLRDASPNCTTPDYVPKSDPKEDGDEDPEEDPIDYPADGGDDGDDGMNIKDEMTNMDIEAIGDEEDEWMLRSKTEPFETDESAATPPPHPAYRMTALGCHPEPLPYQHGSDLRLPDYFAIIFPTSITLSPWSSNHHHIFSHSHHHLHHIDSTTLLVPIRSLAIDCTIR
ncbi:hypothetical protein Tco_0436031 [Tanacetum coccineum]